MPDLRLGSAMRNVLLVDDDMVSREVLATVLTMSNYTVQTASNGEEALAFLESASKPPRLILLDAQLPGLSGAPLIRQLRSVAPQSVLVVISGSKPPEASMEGADGFLLKPFGPEELEQLLKQRTFPTSIALPPKAAATTANVAMTNTAIIDRQKLEQLRTLMPEHALRSVYAALVADLRERQATLPAALQRSNADELRRIGHSIRGGCGMAGAMEAAHLGTLLETEGNQLNNSELILTQLASAIHNLEGMLEAEFPVQENAVPL